MTSDHASLNRIHFAHLSSLFSPTLIRRLATSVAAESIQEILKAAGLAQRFQQCSFREVFEGVYDILRHRYRCEYVYKNAIAAKILLGRHSLQTSGLLTEVQVGASKADLVLINGETVAYEIKTELDSLGRLQSQLASYQAAFDRVYVISHERCLGRVAERLPSEIGLLCLTPRYTILTIREAVSDRTCIDAGVMFDILSSKEYSAIIERCFGFVPAVPNTLLYRECRALFLSLPLELARTEFAAALKRRAQAAVKLPASHFECAPHSLILHMLAGRLGPEQYRRLHLSLV